MGVRVAQVKEREREGGRERERERERESVDHGRLLAVDVSSSSSIMLYPKYNGISIGISTGICPNRTDRTNGCQKEVSSQSRRPILPQNARE